MVKIIIAFLSLLMAAPAQALDGEALLKQIDRNLNPESYELYRKLINVEPDGKKKEFTMFSVKKGADKVAALFLARPAKRGAAPFASGKTCGSTSPTSAAYSTTPTFSALTTQPNTTLPASKRRGTRIFPQP